MKASELYAALAALQGQGLNPNAIEVEVFDFSSGESIEVTDLGLTGDYVFQLKFEYEG